MRKREVIRLDARLYLGWGSAEKQMTARRRNKRNLWHSILEVLTLKIDTTNSPKFKKDMRNGTK